MIRFRYDALTCGIFEKLTASQHDLAHEAEGRKSNEKTKTEADNVVCV